MMRLRQTPSGQCVELHVLVAANIYCLTQYTIPQCTVEWLLLKPDWFESGRLL